MTILFSAIAIGNQIIQNHAVYDGNFIEFTEQILAKISNLNEKLTYTHKDYLIHYIVENGVVYLCITKEGFERSRSFLFLNEIKRRYKDKFGPNLRIIDSNDINFKCFYQVLAFEMKHYSESDDIDTIAKVYGELDELHNIMVKNVEIVTTRGEELVLLKSKTEELSNQSISFRRRTRNLANHLYWKNIRCYFYIGSTLIASIYLFSAYVCGGLTLKKCF